MTFTVGDSRQTRQTVRVLASERDEWFVDFIAVLIHDLARIGVSLVVITPSTVRELDLLELAAGAKWDVGFLFLNNILYASPDRSAGSIERDSVELVQKMVRLFKRPIIACYGYPDSPTFSARVMAAGATAAFQMPCDPQELQQAIKRCLPIW
jgi:CheY-like chemotaxis protein